MKIKRTILTFGTAAVLLLLMVGCDEDKYQLKFSHYIHVTDNEMGCDECHGELGKPSFMAITHKTCIDCHDEPEAEEINAKTCGYCHQEKQLPNLKEWTPAPATSNRNVFVHTEALAGQCKDCHDDLFAEALSSVPKLTRSDIIEIRDDAHASGQDCLTCHTDMDPAQQPESHDLAWTKRHGFFGIQTDAACSVCHTEDSCKQCHSITQPASHNNLWRLRSHGAVASWDRDRCQVCHEEDSCTECHSQTRPRSHTGRWGKGKYASHCIGCHTAASEGEGCMVCHENANDPLVHSEVWGNDGVHEPLYVSGQYGGVDSCFECHYKYDSFKVP